MRNTPQAKVCLRYDIGKFRKGPLGSGKDTSVSP